MLSGLAILWPKGSLAKYLFPPAVKSDEPLLIWLCQPLCSDIVCLQFFALSRETGKTLPGDGSGHPKRVSDFLGRVLGLFRLHLSV